MKAGATCPTPPRVVLDCRLVRRGRPFQMNNSSLRGALVGALIAAALVVGFYESRGGSTSARQEAASKITDARAREQPEGDDTRTSGERANPVARGAVSRGSERSADVATLE